MLTRNVPSSEITAQKGLSARRYVFSPKHEAKALVTAWCKANPVLSVRSPAMLELMKCIELKLREALESKK